MKEIIIEMIRRFITGKKTTLTGLPMLGIGIMALIPSMPTKEILVICGIVNIVLGSVLALFFKE